MSNGITEWAQGPASILLTLAVLEVQRQVRFVDRATSIAVVDELFGAAEHVFATTAGPTPRAQLELIAAAVDLARERVKQL